MLQCLAQTPFLRKVLLDSESDEPITIKLDNEDIVSNIILHIPNKYIKINVYSCIDCETRKMVSIN